jgi:hypothetical protein
MLRQHLGQQHQGNNDVMRIKIGIIRVNKQAPCPGGGNSNGNLLAIVPILIRKENQRLK